MAARELRAAPVSAAGAHLTEGGPPPHRRHDHTGGTSVSCRRSSVSRWPSVTQATQPQRRLNHTDDSPRRRLSHTDDTATQATQPHRRHSHTGDTATRVTEPHRRDSHTGDTSRQVTQPHRRLSHTGAKPHRRHNHTGDTATQATEPHKIYYSWRIICG